MSQRCHWLYFQTMLSPVCGWWRYFTSGYWRKHMSILNWSYLVTIQYTLGGKCEFRQIQTLANDNGLFQVAPTWQQVSRIPQQNNTVARWRLFLIKKNVLWNVNQSFCYVKRSIQFVVCSTGIDINVQRLLSVLVRIQSHMWCCECVIDVYE